MLCYSGTFYVCIVRHFVLTDDDKETKKRICITVCVDLATILSGLVCFSSVNIFVLRALSYEVRF